MTKKKTAKQKTKRPRSKTKQPRKRFGRMLDPQARAYANLLLDPCGAPLVHPVYAGSGSGYLIRVKASQTFTADSVGLAATSGAILFAPGLISSAAFGPITATSNIGAVQAVLMNNTGTTATASNLDYMQPGNGFFAGFTNLQIRPVAACLKVRYVGTELNRSGSVAAGFLSNAESFYSSIPQAGGALGTNVFSNWRDSAQLVSRMPDGDIEVKWSPNRGDMRFRDYSTPYMLTTLPQHSGTYVSWSGLSNGQSIIVETTAVYEWVPGNNVGVIMPTERTNTSAGLDAVLAALGPIHNWMIQQNVYGQMGAMAAREVYRRVNNGLFGGGGQPRIEL